MTSPHDLDAELTDLTSWLDAPSGEGVATVAANRLRGELPTPHGWWATIGAGRRRVVIAGLAVAAVVGSSVAGPAVADWVGVRGIAVRRPHQPATTSTPPSPSPTTEVVPPGGASLDLGAPVTSLAAAEAAAGFAAVVPSSLGAPDAIWVDRRGAAPFISLVYDGGPLVTEFDATLTDDAILSKLARPTTVVEELRIHGEPALWIDGIHEVAVRGRDGGHVFERLRLSDKVLLVQHGPLTVRVEVPSGLGRAEAIRIAESLTR